MEEELQHIEEPAKPQATRPFLLTVISLFSFVFFGFIAGLFLLAVFYSGWITEVVNKYTPEDMESRAQITAFVLFGFLFHASSLAGVVMMWLMKRKGYYVFAISCLIITGYQLSQAKISFTTTVVYILLIIFFGIFFKKLK